MLEETCKFSDPKMQCSAEHDPGRQNSRYAQDYSTKILSPLLPHSGHLPVRNDILQHASFNHDWMNGSPSSSYTYHFRSSEDISSLIVPPKTQVPDFFFGDKYYPNDCAAHTSSLYYNDTLLTSRPADVLPCPTLHSFYNSPSAQSCTSIEGPISPRTSQSYPMDIHCYQSSVETYGGYSCSDQDEDFKFKLQELETVLFSPVRDDQNTLPICTGPMLGESSDWNSETMQEGHENYSQSSLSVYPKLEFVEVSSEVDNDVMPETASDVNQGMICSTTTYMPEQQQEVEIDTATGDVSRLLVECAKAISDGDTIKTENLIQKLQEVVSVTGEPIERLGAYMLEGLVARLKSSGLNIYKALKCKEPTSKEMLSYMHVLYEACPFFKFGYTAANGAIAEAFKGEQKVHIIDFQIAMGSQWVTLIQALSKRPNGPPHVRITGIDDPMAEFARGGGLDIVGTRLSKIAKSCNVPFEFHAVPVMGSDVEANMIECRPGEALAVNFPFQLHHMPDESVSLYNHRDRILQMVKGFSPKVVTLVEQEANTNTSAFFPRFKETLSYYTAMFESLDVKLPRDSVERINVEQQCLARDIVNVIACEGADRVERHELLSKWKIRFMMVGFKPYPLSKCVNSTIKELLQDYSQQYRYFEKEDALYLGWLDRDLVTASAWH
eukprot:TRINITY_DN13493_c0_g2_i1.p1 TRINITY_DN13493_c0_g2~~TRINITY_DN13493_c0_g2_i1.p1  ORF type:complete len:666 (-),score=114.04 TRINITY_DN13493_c0_g2_i1:398-2395(-)